MKYTSQNGTSFEINLFGVLAILVALKFLFSKGTKVD